MKNKILPSILVLALIAAGVWYLFYGREAQAAFVQSAFGQGTSGTTRDAVLGSDVEVGQLVVTLASLEGSNMSITFSNSGTATLSSWTEVANLDQYDAGDGNGQEVAYAIVTGAGSLTVRATYGTEPSWGGIGAATFDAMPGTLELQDSQYDNVTIQNPDGTDMTPTSAPAMVIGFAVRWGSPFETPGVDTGAGFVDGGSGATYTGTALMRITYQRITNTTPLDLEFTTVNSGRVYLSGLIFSETTPTNSVNFFWRAEGATLDNTHDYSVGDTTATLGSTAAINTDAAYIGTNGLDIPSSSDNAQFTVSNGDIINTITGSFGFWFRMVTFTTASMFAAVENAQQANNITIARSGTDDATGREILFRIRRSGGANVTLTTTDADLALNTWYFVLARFDEPNNDRRLEIYNTDGSLRTAVEDLATNFDQLSALDTLYIGEIGGGATDVHIDNIFIADDYNEPLEDNMNITSWTEYGAAADTLPINVRGGLNVRGGINFR